MYKDKGIKNDVLISYAYIFIALITTFILTKIQVSYLEREFYGILGLVNSTIGYIAILDLGVGQTITKYISEYRAKGEYKKVNQISAYSFKNYIVISIIGLFIGLIIMLYSQNIFKSLNNHAMVIFNKCFFIALINVLLQIPAATFSSVLTAYNEFRNIKLLNIVKVLLRVLIVFIMLRMGLGLVSIFLVDLIINQLINISYYLLVKYKIHVNLDFTPISKELKKELSSYSFFVFLGIITDQIFWKTDSILLGIMSTTTSVAIFTVSSQIVSQYLNICSTFSSTFLPRIVEKIANGDGYKELNKFFIKSSRYQFMLTGIILISYIFLGGDFINFWVGERYTEAYVYGAIIMVSLSIPMSQTTGYQILFALNKHKVRSVIYLFNAIINLVVSVLLFNYIGVIGVALATAISMILGNVIFMNIYYKISLKIKVMEYFKEVFLKTGFVLLITSLVYFFLNKLNISGVVWFLVKGIIGCAIYGILIIRISLIEEEKNKINKLIMRIKRT